MSLNTAARSPSRARSIPHQYQMAITYLIMYLNGLAHNDGNVANIMITRDEKGRRLPYPRFTLIDFGSSTFKTQMVSRHQRSRLLG